MSKIKTENKNEVSKLTIWNDAGLLTEQQIKNEIVRIAEKHYQKHYILAGLNKEDLLNHYMYLRCLDERIPCKNSYYNYYFITADGETKPAY